MPAALPSPEGPVFCPDPHLWQAALESSRKSPRRRIIQPVQRSERAQVQRLMNFLQPGTYVRPHRHPGLMASESVVLLAGALDVLIFDERGELTARHELRGPGSLIDLEPGVWHGMIVQAPDTVIFEVKCGPYEPEADKDFASWAPEEGDPAVTAFLDRFGD